MKKIIAFSLLIFTISFAKAQIGIGPKNDLAMLDGKFEQDDLDMLMQTKTFFYYRKIDEPQLENWKKIFAEVWNITEVEFIPAEKMSLYTAKSNYSNFTICEDVVAVVNQSQATTSQKYWELYYYLQLWYNKVGNNGKTERKSFCRIQLIPCGETYSVANTNPAKTPSILYTTATFKNYLPGLMKFQIKTVNDYLKEGKTREMRYSQPTTEEISNLKANTLFMIDDVNPMVLKKVGKGLFDDDPAAEAKAAVELFSNYPFGYEITTRDSLNEKIMTSDDEFYFMYWFRESRMITIVNSKTSEIIYLKPKNLQPQLSLVDIKSLLKAINGE